MEYQKNTDVQDFREIEERLQQLWPAPKETALADACRVAVLEIQMVTGQAARECMERHERVIEKYVAVHERFTGLVNAITGMVLEHPYRDVLGCMYHYLDLGCREPETGLPQGLALQRICELSAEELRREIAREKVLRIIDPLCGSGADILTAAGAIKDGGHDPGTVMLIYAWDIEPVIVDMCYLQLASNNLTGIVEAVCSRTQLWTPYMIGMTKAAGEIS